MWSGLEGVGKSVFAAWVIARLTRGELPGQLKNAPIDVLVVASEDGIEDTWKPRVDLADADLDRVHFLHIPTGWNVRDGIDLMRLAMKSTGARVLFIDAALDHMPDPKAGESVNSPTFVRATFDLLRRMTRELDSVGLFSMHPPKAKGVSFRDLVQASQALSAIPRVGLYIAYHPDDDEDDPACRRIVLRGKGNIGRNPGALEFRIGETPYVHDDGRVQGREFVDDVGPSDVTMADVRPDKVVGRRAAGKTDQAVAFLDKALFDGGWHEAAPLLAELTAHGISETVIRDASRRLAVAKRKRPDEVDGPWEWRLPATDSETADD